jgi:hypothetical protein
MNLKVKQLIAQVIFVALVFPFFTKNYLDILVAPLVILLASLVIASVSSLLRISKSKEEFIAQINYSFLVIGILYFLGFVFI